VSLATNIVRRQGSRNYYVRVGIPKDLQTRLGTPGKPKRERWQSLNTTNPYEAKRSARPIVDQWEREFEELRRPKQLTEAELQEAVWRRYLELVTADEKFRQALPTGEDLNQIWAHLESEFGGVYEVDAFRILEMIRDEFEEDQRLRAARLAKIRTDAARGETEAVASVVRRVMDERRLDLETRSPEYRKLAQGIQRAELEALNRSAERDVGDWSGQPKDKLVQPPTAVAYPPGEKITELFDRFKRESSGRVSPDTWDQNRKIVVLFDEFVGGKAHVSALNRKNLRDWKTELFRWPVKAADTKVFRGLTFAQIIDKNETVSKPTISGQTINKYLAALGGFCSWLLSNDFIKEDVMAGMYLRLDRDKRNRFPFDPDQLKAIFSSPLFSKCAGDKREAEKGQITIRDWRYWIPWIGLYTGARLGEIAQLLTADVRQLHGVWIFHVTREGSALKSTKTKGSQRVVPIHSELIKLGFLDYHAGNVVRGEKQLFPEIKPDGRGFFSGEPSAFFNGYFRDIGVKIDRKVNFHSFRHGVADAFRNAGYYDEQFNVLLGHTKATTTGKYGLVPEGILSQRVTMIEAVEFQGIQ
jgi:integrase